MPKWKKDETEFTVSVNYSEVHGYQTTIPKPIMELLGEPEKITFEVTKSKKIEIRSGK